MKIELTHEDYQMLLLALGIAGGTASREGNRGLFCGFLKLANIISKDNPDWTPYEVPES